MLDFLCSNALGEAAATLNALLGMLTAIQKAGAEVRYESLTLDCI